MAIIGIVAVAENLAIGKNGGLPWRYPSDLKFFKSTTTGNAVVMGYKTWASVGKPLPNRLNIVLSRSAELENDSSVVLMRSKRAVLTLKDYLNCDLYIIGGGGIYELFRDNIERWVVTRIPQTVENADTFLPADFLSGFKLSNNKQLDDSLYAEFYRR